MCMKKFCVILLVGVACLVAGWLLGRKAGEHFADVGKMITVRDTITINDTIVKEKPIHIRETIVKTDTFTVNDTILVEIPITQKVYEDSLYKAWVSGYKPSLDSLVLFQPKEVITEQVFVPKIERKKARWGIGIQVGYGTDFQEFSPYIGIGVHYNIFSW